MYKSEWIVIRVCRVVRIVYLDGYSLGIDGLLSGQWKGQSDPGPVGCKCSETGSCELLILGQAVEILENRLELTGQNAYTARTPWPCVKCRLPAFEFCPDGF
jgi:hypothetical protein